MEKPQKTNKSFPFGQISIACLTLANTFVESTKNSVHLFKLKITCQVTETTTICVHQEMSTKFDFESNGECVHSSSHTHTHAHGHGWPLCGKHLAIRCRLLQPQFSRETITEWETTFRFSSFAVRDFCLILSQQHLLSLKIQLNPKRIGVRARAFRINFSPRKRFGCGYLKVNQRKHICNWSWRRTTEWANERTSDWNEVEYTFNAKPSLY